MQARSVLKHLQEHLSVLYAPSSTKGNPPAIWLPRPPTFNQGDKALISRWRQYLKWEESNPLEIEDSNRNTFIQRVQGVYKNACVRMRYYSDIWCVFYRFCISHVFDMWIGTWRTFGLAALGRLKKR